MFSKRFFSLFLLIVSFGFFAGAKPIGNRDVAIRGLGDVSKNDVTGLTRRETGNSVGDLLSVLNALQDVCTPLIGQLDGNNDPAPIVAEIVAKIKASVDVIAAIQINGDVDISVCVNIIVTLILNICAGISLYSLTILAELWVQLDVCITAWVKVIIQICPDICVTLAAGLKVDIVTQLSLLVALLKI